ncbi:MAG: hypothetical protein R2873_24465 [Caldilineaceae bacterium]
MIRTMRVNLLDELPQPYVESAPASGLTTQQLKYPVRIAMSPFSVSTIGWMLPSLISGTTIVAIVPQPAYDGSAAAQGPPFTGHVLGGVLHHAAQCTHDPRHADFGHSAGAGGSADSV